MAVIVVSVGVTVFAFMTKQNGQNYVDGIFVAQSRDFIRPVTGWLKSRDCAITYHMDRKKNYALLQNS